MTELPPHASPVDLIGPGTVIREWEVVRFLGRGSYGVVFEAKRSSWLHEPHRALKVFDPIVSGAARSALLGEFGALTGVRHPHLLAGIDAFDLTEAPFAGCVVFVLELADEDLSHRVARGGALPPAEVAAIGAQVADGLTALHGQGRIHGDVKPENLLRAGDRWTLGDFGVSGLLEGSYAVTTGATIDYRPPELARAEEGSRLHRSADVWALGVTLHVAATARHPFAGPDPLMRFAAAVRDDRQPAPMLDPTLAAILDAGCLAPDPRTRLDAPTLADHLRAWPRRLPGLPALAPPTPAPVAPDRPAPPSPTPAPTPASPPPALGDTPSHSAPTPAPPPPALGDPPSHSAPTPAPPPPALGDSPASAPVAPGRPAPPPALGDPPGSSPTAPGPDGPVASPWAASTVPDAPPLPSGPTPRLPSEVAWAQSSGALPVTEFAPPGTPVPGPPGSAPPSPPPAPARATSPEPTPNPEAAGAAGAFAPPGGEASPGPAALPSPERQPAAPRPAPTGPHPWLVAAVVGVLALAITQVVAVLAGAALDGDTARRLAYVVVSVPLVAAVALVARRRVPNAAMPATVAAAAVWLVATAELFLVGAVT